MSLSARQRLILLAAAGSAMLMLGALAFQHIGGLAPCKLCLWQRWPHVAAIGFGLGALVALPGLMALGGMLSALATAAIGGFHAGIERGWWEGPTTCSSPMATEGLSADDLFEQIMAAPLVRCDEIPWEMLGLSMAGWNMVLSLGLAAVWAMALRSR